MMNLFDYDSAFATGLRKIATCVALSCLWMVCCVPLFTAGASTAALIYAMRKCVLRDEDHVLRNFFGCFRRDFRFATVLFLGFLAVEVFLAWDIWVFYNMFLEGQELGLLAIIVGLLWILVLLWWLYATAYLVRFQDSWRQTLKNCLMLMLTNPIQNLKLLMLLLLVVISGLTLPVFLLITPGIACLFGLPGIERIFRRVMRPEDVQRVKEAEETPNSTKEPT